MEIRLINISKKFNNTKVLDNINLTIKSKKFTTLLGPSGCGKTTLLRIISGLETPDSGEIYFDNNCVFSKEKGIDIITEKRGIGFVFQDFALWPHMTVFENVAFGLRATGKKENLQQKVTTALASVRLDGFEKRYPHQLSGGQQQRVSFARAIATNPSCILFDEPLSALDAVLRDEMRTELRLLVEKHNVTAIFVTHDQTEAMSMSDEIVVMHKGEVQQIGTPEEIYNTPANKIVAQFVGISNWISETEMLRPEQIILGEETKYSTKMKVVNIQFLGRFYQVLLSNGKDVFTAYSNIKYNLEQTIPVYINKTQVVKF